VPGEVLRGLLGAAPDAMLGVDDAGRIVIANGQAERLFGYDPGELDGQLIEVLVPESVRSVHPQRRAHYMAHTATRPMGAGLQLEGRRKDRSTFPAEISLSAIETAEDVRVVAAIRDVTEHRRAESEIRAARDEAQLANQAKSEFLSRMSHELRTPLNAILGFGQLLEVNDPRPQQAEHIDFILKAGRHLLDLIDEVLDISRIEAGKLDLDLVSVAIAPMVREIADLLRPLATEHAVLVRIDADADRSIRVLADEQRLKQVVLNLLANAIKYNRSNGEVDISWTATAGRVKVTVSDTGVGIRPEALDRLFMPFERLSTDVDIQGTGLGLALSKGLVRSMNGQIGAESDWQHGSTFWVELLEGFGADEEPGDPMPEMVGPVRRVLYVEDNLSNLRLVEEILAGRPDIELVPTLQGGLAFDLARQHRPDLVLLDLHLPDLDGEEVLARLRGDPATSDIPVIIVSADATPSRVSSLLEQGVFGYLTKPFDVIEFLDLVELALLVPQSSRHH
jgi:PAS domain S-box-containing protein